MNNKRELLSLGKGETGFPALLKLANIRKNYRYDLNKKNVVHHDKTDTFQMYFKETNLLGDVPV